MTGEPIPARRVRDRILCGARDHGGYYWCRGVIAGARQTPDGRWEAFRLRPGYWRPRRVGYVPEGAVFTGQAYPLPFTDKCPNPSCGAVAIVNSTVLESA